MQRLEVRGAVQPIYRSLGFKGLKTTIPQAQSLITYRALTGAGLLKTKALDADVQITLPHHEVSKHNAQLWSSTNNIFKNKG